MRVLHVITGLGIGGAEHQLRLLLRHLPYACEVVTLTNAGPVADAIRADGTPVHLLGMRGNRDLSALPRLVRLMRAGRFDVVHTHLYRACLYGRLAARLAGVPHVLATEHSLGDGIIEGRRTTPGVRALYRASERLGGVTIAVSAAVAQRLVGWGIAPGRIRVVPNGIDAAELRHDPALRQAARARLGIPRTARVIGAVGRLEPTKRFDVLVHALRTLPDATLLLVGDGSARAALADLARATGVAERVVFAGAALRVRDLFSAMDLLASPSTRETFGLAVVEALAAGLPTLYASCPPLEALPATAAPGARRVSGAAWPAALREALIGLDPVAGRRYPVPPAVAQHDVARLAAEIGRVYIDLTRATPHHRTVDTERAGR